MVTPRALRQLLLLITLNCLNGAAFIAKLCSHLIPVQHTKIASHVPQNVHVKTR